METSLQNVPEPLGSITCRVTETILTEEAVSSVVGVCCSLPPQDAAGEPETLQVLHIQMSESALAALKSAGVL